MVNMVVLPHFHFQRTERPLNMSILSNFGIDVDAFSAFNDTSLFAGSGTTMLRQDKKTAYTGSINGNVVQAYVTMREARLTRISKLRQVQASTGNEYSLVTGILKPVKFDIDIIVDGVEMSLVDLLKHFAEAASGATFSNDEFLHNARRIGFNVIDGMPLFFQQFGASDSAFDAAVDAFRSAGAVDAKGNKDMGRIVAAYSHETGVPVTALELGSVDRTQSPRNQGFLNLIDAQVDQFQRVLGLRKKSNVLKAQANDASLSQKQIKALTEEAKIADEMSRQWVSSWSGAQQRIVNENGRMVAQNLYDPVNAPCGRFTMVIGGSEVPVDLWTNRARANSTESVAKPAKTGPVEPF